jgi:hypothetical protein
MKHAELFWPRVMATLLLLGSLSMLVPLGAAAVRLASGEEVAVRAWALPLAILGAGTALTAILSRRQVPVQLYLAAFGLFLVTLVYYWVRFGALL